MEKYKSTIKILPEYIANQIAAGEVVQRPESVVKELVENSLDAGATSIGVVIKGSGKILIHVIDNGKGMSREDLALAPLRHSTSKITTQEDLQRILTYGFRGEALASISAVSSMEIRTKRAEDEHGWSLKSEPNQPFQISPIKCDNGTQVFVRNLFFNVPARKKFLKSDITEYRHITETMTRFALIHFDKRIVYYDSDNLILDLHPSDLQKRIENIFGEEISQNIMPVDYANDYLRISGFLGKPHAAKPTAAQQFLFVNKRAILSKNLNYAIFAAFEHLLEKNYKPFYVLNLEIDPEKVDINIHPQKNEVKFDDERKIFSALHHVVNNCISKYNLTAMHIVSKPEKSPFERVDFKQEPLERLIVNQKTGEIITQNRTFNALLDYKPKLERPNSKLFEKSAFDLIFNSENTQEFHPPKEKIEITDDAQFMQIHNKYLLMQSPQGIFIIDQHNAHERILYEKAIKIMTSELANMQTLLFPVVAKISPEQAAIAEEIESDLKKLGYDFKLDKNGSLELYSVPLDISEGEAISSFTDIIAEYLNLMQIKHSAKRDNLAASFACRSAIKTGQKLSHNEMLELARQLMNCSMPYVCPHGRPVVLEISLRDLDKSFKRI